MYHRAILLFVTAALIASAAAARKVAHPACPPGDWLRPRERLRREARLRSYVRSEERRLWTFRRQDRVAKDGCLADTTRVYGYEHPAWPKPAPLQQSQQRNLAPNQRRRHRHDRGPWLPQILWAPRAGLMIHTLWKAGTTTIKLSFPHHRVRGMHNLVAGDPPPRGFPPHTSVMLARDPLDRFASGVGEVYLRGVHHNHVGGGRVLWWRKRHQAQSNLAALVGAMLRDVERFEISSLCMDTHRQHPLRHLLTAGAFYSRARYPEAWLRHGKTVSYDQVWVVGPATGRLNASGDHVVPLDEALRQHATVYPVERGRDSHDRPDDVPSTGEVKAAMLDPALLRRFCRIYAADYFCFGWDPPQTCDFLSAD